MDNKATPMWSAFLWQGEHNRRKRQTINFLRNVPLFSTLTRRELRHLNSIVHHRTYQADEFLFRKGQPGAAMFIIKSGEINILDQDHHHRENVVATLKDNSFFGELALLDDSPRSASAKAVTTTEIYAFFRNDLDRLMSAFPHIGLQVYRALSLIIGVRLKSANEQLLNK